ncbi:site-specific integrase [Neisseria sp. Ec49-e6-T10]|uniref:site-specific integrase n=1 Tax=Neisseria sp. Ec49-e6-T10 TaxID=3140744 RepID=UPI003EBA9451
MPSQTHADQSKTRQSIGTPLNDDALNIIMSQKEKHKLFVFTYKDMPIKNANASAFKKAVKRAGLGDFHFHDLRHTWATRHIMSGTSQYELQELGGWSSPKTMRKYAHLSTTFLLDVANNVSKAGTKLAQNKFH